MFIDYNLRLVYEYSIPGWKSEFPYGDMNYIF